MVSRTRRAKCLRCSSISPTSRRNVSADLSGRCQVGLFLLSTVGSFLIVVSDSTANQAGEHERNPDLEKIEYLRADRGGLAWFFGSWDGGSACTKALARAKLSERADCVRRALSARVCEGS